MKKILVVDDFKAIRNLIIATLRKRDVRIFEAENGLEAIDIAKREIPDVIIMDVMMPQLNGFEATQKIKADPATKHSVVIILTAKKLDEYKEEGFCVEADEFLTKPFSPQELIAIVNKYL